MSATAPECAVALDVHLSDFVLARLGGAPASRLDAAILSRTARSLQQAFACEADRDREAAIAEAALFRLVPTAARAMRGRILQLRRGVRSGTLRDTALVADVAGLLTAAEERNALLEWQRLSEERDAHLAAAAASCASELAEASSAVRRWLDDPMLRRGVALASPGFIEALDADHARPDRRAWRPSGRLARTCMSYYQRAAMKTSPFSTLTPIDLWPLGSVAARPSPPPAGQGVAVQLARMVPMTWLELIARDREIGPALSFELNPSLTTGLRVLRGAFVFDQGFAWRDESLESLDPNVCDARLLHRLRAQGPTFTLTALAAALAQSRSQVSPVTRLRALLDAQVVRPVAPFARRAVDPARRLAEAVSRLGTPRATQIGELMHRVADDVDACATAGASQRLALLRDVRTHALRVCASLGEPSPVWSDRPSLVYENARWSGPPVHLPEAVRADLRTVMRAARAHMVRSTLARFVYRHFLERFGPDGETADIVEFLASFVDRDDFTELVARALAEDRRALARPAPTDETWAGQAPAAATVYFQIAASGADALQRGDFTLIVNQIGSGYGGLIGRFADVLDPSGEGLRQRLRAWLAAVRPDAMAIETPMINDWSNLHPVVGVGDQVLRWPGEVAVTDGRAAEHRLDELSLRADDANDELYFVDRQGRRIAPVYLGVTPTERISGMRGLFLLLLDPWVSDHSLGRRLRRFAADDPGDARIEYSPREAEGRIAYRRAQWRVPIACLPRQAANEEDFAFLVRLERWRRASGLPEESFAECVVSDAGPSSSSKPIWVHFHSPHAYGVLTATIRESTTAVYFTEVLPRRDQHWSVPTSAGPQAGDRRVAEFLALGSVVDRPAQRAGRPRASYGPRPCDGEWLYLKIHPGSLSLLDETVRSVVSPAIDRMASDVRQWFFVRYIDDRGPHIRLRVRPRSADPEVAAGLHRIVTERLASVSQATARRLLVPMRQDESPAGWRGVTMAPYRPEYVKYGGVATMDVVERWFERSSTIARQMLTGPFDAVVAAAFMEAIVSSTDARRFWTHYLWHWTGQHETGAAQLRGFFLRAARERRAAFTDRLARAVARPAVQTLVTEFRTATIEALSQVRALTTADQAESVRFDLVHMHNNRLGVVPMEEAYLASLLIDGGTHQARVG